MRKRPTKTTLVMIIILLIIVVPIAGYGTYLHVTYVPEVPKCDIDFGNGCYICKNPSTCGLAQGIIDDDNYNFNYYKSDDTTIKIKGGVYSFIKDNAEYDSDTNVVLYNISEGQSMKIAGVKNYGVGIDNNYFIAKNDNGLWGIIKIDSSINIGVPYTYNFIGISNSMYKDGILSSSKFAVLKDDSWKIITYTGEDLSAVYDKPIYDYNDTFVALYDEANSSYHLVDYTGLDLTSDSFKEVLFSGNYIGVLDSTNNFYVFSSLTRGVVSQSYSVIDISEATLEDTGNGLQLIINGNAVENIV